MTTDKVQCPECGMSGSHTGAHGEIRCSTCDAVINDNVNDNLNMKVNIRKNHIQVASMYCGILENLVIWASGTYVYDIRYTNMMIRTDNNSSLTVVWW